MASVRSLIRTKARYAALGGLSKIADWQGGIDEARTLPSVQFPYLHGVPHSELGEFRKLLAELSTTHHLISYSDAIDKILHGPIDKPYAAFSFDDGFKSNYAAAKILEEFGTTGMFFVPTNAVGLSSTIGARNFYGFDYGCDEPVMSWSDLEDLKSAGHEIGNHTVNHTTISTLSTDQICHEIGAAAERLRERLGSCDHFAWPNGRFFHFKPEAIPAAFEFGHTSCASAERGAHTAVHYGTKEDLCIRRDHVMTSWPIKHNIYFLATSAQNANAESNSWPSEWRHSPTGRISNAE